MNMLVGFGLECTGFDGEFLSARIKRSSGGAYRFMVEW